MNHRTTLNLFLRSTTSSRSVLVTLAVWMVLVAQIAVTQIASAQETKIWEFSPYEVQVWINYDPVLPLSQEDRTRFMDGLRGELERTFRAAWRLHVTETPEQVARQVSRSLPSLEVADLSRNEFVLVVSTTHPETKAVRTFQAAADSITSIMVSSSTYAALTSASKASDIAANSPVANILQKMSIVEQGDEAIKEALAKEEIAAALLPRPSSEGIDKTRPVITPLPWQSATFLNERDKIFFLNVGQIGDDYEVTVRELDCPMLHFGPIFSAKTTSWLQMPRLASCLVQRGFAPVARVESAETFSAELRHKAGGLIVDDNEDGELNPARLRVGDVMHPIIRRDDRNGNPALLQALVFTYCAVTESDGVKMKANVYTYSGGPGLQGRQNRRTQRMVLRVRPAVEDSDVKIVVRGSNQRSQPGCFVYSKDFLTDEFKFLGRTDWRGRVPVEKPETTIGILPDAVRVARAAAMNDARKEALAAAQKEYEEALKKAEESGEQPPKPPDPNPNVQVIPVDPKTVVQLNSPLMMLYVKSGDTVLAKLPYVPGLHDIDVAELMDDSLRLQSEALVRGFQSEILDLIGLRNLLTARAKLLIKDGKLEKAATVVEELRKLRDFNKMNDELGKLERQILEQATANPPPRAGQVQIDRMFKSTREMLQKYLQDDLASMMADQLRKATTGEAPSGT